MGLMFFVEGARALKSAREVSGLVMEVNAVGIKSGYSVALLTGNCLPSIFDPIALPGTAALTEKHPG